jgi:hypothetical protein
MGGDGRLIHRSAHGRTVRSPTGVSAGSGSVSARSGARPVELQRMKGTRT